MWNFCLWECPKSLFQLGIQLQKIRSDHEIDYLQGLWLCGFSLSSCQPRWEGCFLLSKYLKYNIAGHFCRVLSYRQYLISCWQNFTKMLLYFDPKSSYLYFLPRYQTHSCTLVCFHNSTWNIFVISQHHLPLLDPCPVFAPHTINLSFSDLMQSPFSLVLVKPTLVIFLAFDTTLEGILP